MLIVTDGAVDLPAGIERSPLLRVVPGHVWLDDQPLVTDLEGFWALLRRGRYPSTTPPTVNALAEAYRHHEPVLAVHVSAALSATVERAQEAATRSGPGSVVVVDTGSLSVGSGLIVAAVHHALHSSLGQDSTTHLARSLALRLHTFALVADIESLRRSQRVGLLPRGRLAHGRPLILAVRGRAVPLEQAKDRSAALRQLVAHVRRGAGQQIGAWALGHADASDRDELVRRLGQALGRPPSFVTCLDPTVGVHVGPESVIIGAISGPVEV